jgi:hypothetical protein
LVSTFPPSSRPVDRFPSAKWHESGDS